MMSNCVIWACYDVWPHDYKLYSNNLYADLNSNGLITVCIYGVFFKVEDSSDALLITRRVYFLLRLFLFSVRLGGLPQKMSLLICYVPNVSQLCYTV